MRYDNTNYLEFVLEKCPHAVDLGLEKFDDMRQWCLDHLGPPMFIITDEPDEVFNLNEKGVWDYGNFVFYFASDLDALRLKLTYG
jgi:hypothetical protein